MPDEIKQVSRVCETPKFSGAHRRLVRPEGGLSAFHGVASVILVLMVAAIFALVIGQR